VTFARVEVPEMDMDDARALVERAPRFARHFVGRDGGGIDRRVGENAG
jgi:hypothetical protein